MTSRKREEKKKTSLCRGDGEGEVPVGIKRKTICYPGGRADKVVPDVQSPWSVFWGWLLAIWILASMAGTAALASNEETSILALLPLGLGFFVAGLVASFKGGGPGLIFTTVGVCCAVGGFLGYYGSDDIEKWRIAPVAISLIAIAIGIDILISGIRRYKFAKRLVPVIASCTYIERETVSVQKYYESGCVDEPTAMWVAYYRYCYDGAYYYANCTGTPVNKGRPELGQCKTVYVNPKKPDEYREANDAPPGFIGFFVVGTMFLVGGAIALTFTEFP